MGKLSIIYLSCCMVIMVFGLILYTCMKVTLSELHVVYFVCAVSLLLMKLVCEENLYVYSFHQIIKACSFSFIALCHLSQNHNIQKTLWYISVRKLIVVSYFVEAVIGKGNLGWMWCFVLIILIRTLVVIGWKTLQVS